MTESIRPLSDVRRVALIGYQTAAAMLFGFGAVGLLLAAMGTYGLVSYTVLQQRREIGVRMALGATSVGVVRTFLARGLRIAGAGTLLGLIAAYILIRLLGSVRFGITLLEPMSFAQALAIVFGGVLLATAVPSWRATRIDPAVVMRHQ